MTKLYVLVLSGVALILGGCERQAPTSNGTSKAPEVTEQPAEVQEPAAQESQTPPAEPAKQAGIQWYTDFETAKAKAAEENKHLFINFSGSDWCFWCQKLDEEVLSVPAFYEEAQKHFVFVLADFPSDESTISAEQKKKNRLLMQYYGVQGFPSIILSRANGKAYAMTGYEEGGAESYLKHLLELKQQAP